MDRDWKAIQSILQFDPDRRLHPAFRDLLEPFNYFPQPSHGAGSIRAIQISPVFDLRRLTAWNAASACHV